METLSGCMNLLWCVTTSRPTKSEAAGAQCKSSRKRRTRSEQIQQKPNLWESQLQQDHLAQCPVCQRISYIASQAEININGHRLFSWLLNPHFSFPHKCITCHLFLCGGKDVCHILNNKHLKGGYPLWLWISAASCSVCAGATHHCIHNQKPFANRHNTFLVRTDLEPSRSGTNHLYSRKKKHEMKWWFVI